MDRFNHLVIKIIKFLFSQDNLSYRFHLEYLINNLVLIKTVFDDIEGVENTMVINDR